VTKEVGKQKQALRDVKKNKVRPTRTVWIGGNPDTVEQLGILKGRRRQIQNLLDVRGDEAKDSDRRNLQEVENEIEELKEQLRNDPQVLTFKFVSLGRKKYEKLIKEFPPTAEQRQLRIRIDRCVMHRTHHGPR
jgi:hypothetical protein